MPAGSLAESRAQQQQRLRAPTAPPLPERSGALCCQPPAPAQAALPRFSPRGRRRPLNACTARRLQESFQ
ncbi:hypothetical protein NDU88_004054 [Pleurodeles waltl]|uniref:Uncharacterized protein n=1 Tax=Pleurodeles waltl TaxID=8319 RepID=A0AAV7L0S8_PLEWA|nr:hypothetical protein NDU88_004054 [Pleurodeles waltl]